MNIVLTGSLGHISKPLAETLLQNNHSVTVISSKADKQKDIEALGAKAATGSIDDADFLTKVFTGADIVYLMEPPFNFFDNTLDIESYWMSFGDAYKKAVQQAGVKRIVHLSSIGGHTNEGVGMLAIHHNIENILKELPHDVSIKFMRPVGFYYNMFAFIPTIKAQNAIFQNYGGDEKEPWVSPLDIAAVIAEEMEKPFEGRNVRYIASDEVSPNEVANILGNAVGKPDVKWITVPDEQFLNNLLSAGFNPEAAKGYVNMNISRRHNLYDDYNTHKPELGKVKLTDFAKEFTTVYNNQ